MDWNSPTGLVHQFRRVQPGGDRVLPEMRCLTTDAIPDKLIMEKRKIELRVASE